MIKLELSIVDALQYDRFPVLYAYTIQKDAVFYPDSSAFFYKCTSFSIAHGTSFRAEEMKRLVHTARRRVSDVHIRSVVKFSQASQEEIFCCVNLCRVRAMCLVFVGLEERKVLVAHNEAPIWYCAIV